MSAGRDHFIIASLSVVSASATALLCWQWWLASRKETNAAPTDVLLPMPESFAPKELLTQDEQSIDTTASQSARVVWSNIRKRRSIFPKDFTPTPVPLQFIEEALSCANWAPTHGKTQPWRFVVCQKKSMKKLRVIKDEFFERTLDGEKLDAYRKKTARKK